MIDSFFSRILNLKIHDFFLKIIHYRYIIGLIVFIILVFFKVNGSSIGQWDRVLFGTEDKTEILGQSRSIRSDEWLVQTPYYLAQANSPTPYSVNNPNVSTSGQNMIISYDAPVKDISILSKPLNWGFLLLGDDYGLAWYWNMKIILFILLSYEICLIITKGNKMISVLGSFWISYSPAVQWWFMQHVGDIIFYMEAIIVCFYFFLKCFNKIGYKILFAILFSLSCVGYALTLYPAIQVPMAYLCLAFMILIFTDFYKKIKFRIVDFLIIGFSGILIIVLLVHVFLISKDAIYATLNTYYPGKRVSNGGECPPLFIYNFLTNIFLPYKNINYLNNCEISSFYNFLPAVILILPFMIRKKVGNLKYGITFAAFSLACIMYMYVKIPVALAKITLLSYVTYRITNAYGLAALYLSVWALSELSKLNLKHKVYCAAVSIIITASYFSTIYFSPLKNYVHLRYYLVFLLVLLVLNFTLLQGQKWLFSVCMFAVIAVSGFTVNPVNIGLGEIYKNSLSASVKQIQKSDPNANWIGTNNFLLGAFLYANGVKALDGTNYYPDMKKWALLDPQGKYNAVYNRYEHITFMLTRNATSFETTTADSIIVYLNIDDIKKLNVRYIVSTDTLESYDSNTLAFTKQNPENFNGYYIYKVNYR